MRAKLPIQGGTLAYETVGKGTPVLFLHSVIADSRMWDREVPLFASDHQAIRFDLRGFGGSSPALAPFSYLDDIQALLTHLRVPRAYLVGSSMGGAIAIDFALEHPEMVLGLFLAAPGLAGGVPPPFEPAEQKAFEYDDRISQQVAQAWSAGDPKKAFELLRQLWCSALEGSALALFRSMVEENAAEVFENRSMKLARDTPPAAWRLGSIKVPTTVLVGDRDNPSSEVFTSRMARAIGGCRSTTIRGADHLINLSRPSDFDVALRGALKEIG